MPETDVTLSTGALSPGAAALAEKLDPATREIIARYPQGRSRSALLPLLHLVQAEQGHVTPAGVEYCAAVLGITKAQVAAVATFYTMYKRYPTGDWLVSVCTNTMCNVLGGQQVYDTLAEHLGVGHEQTTADGKITLEHAECLAACDYGPVLTVNYEFFDRVAPDAAVGIVEKLRDGQRPEPTRGMKLCTFKEMALQLAGFDGRGDTAYAGPEGPAAGDPTLRGAKLAERHGISVAGFDPNTPIVGKGDAPPAKAQAGQSPPAKPPAGQSPPAKPSAAPAQAPAPTKVAPTKPAPAETVPATPAAAPAQDAGAAASPPASDSKPAGDAPEGDPRERSRRAARKRTGTSGAAPAEKREEGQ